MFGYSHSGGERRPLLPAIVVDTGNDEFGRFRINNV